MDENIKQTLIKAKEVMVPLVEDATCETAYAGVAAGLGWLDDNGEVRLSLFFFKVTRLCCEIWKDLLRL